MRKAKVTDGAKVARGADFFYRPADLPQKISFAPRAFLV
jgi:hypothetical protein